MFNNPLRKYQQGGQTPSKEQEQMMAAFIQWLPKRVKEFADMQPEQIVEALNGMSATEEGKAQVESYLKQFQQEMSGQSFRNGGKIHDFICKHAKGGRVDCGCGGTKIKFGAEGDKLPKQRSEDKTVTIIGIGTPEQVIKGTYDYPSTNGEFEFGKYGKTANVWDNTGGFPKRYADEEWIRRHPIRQMIPFVRRKPAPEGFFENLGERVINRFPEAKFEDGGTIKSMQDGGGFARAAEYYQNHANEGIIRKLQNFLYSRGYDLGDAGIDGRFGQSTYNAIRQYQRDNGLVDDGMWGEDTNSVHRVLGAGDTTFNGSRSGAHQGSTITNNFVNQPYNRTESFDNANDQRKYLNDITSRAYSNPEWFWSDSDDASAARQYLYNLKNNGQNVGEDFIRDMYYNWTSPELQSTIDYKKLPKDISVDRTVTTQRENTNRNAKNVAIGAGALAGTLLGTEAIPTIAEYAPSIVNGIRTAASNGLRGYWNPEQARVGTFFRRIPNGSITNNMNGQFVPRAGMNMGQFTQGTDYAGTIANNLRMLYANLYIR